MASTYKVLGQVAPIITTATTLYTVPAATSTVASTLTICNFGAPTTYRVAVRPAGAALAALHYIAYDSTINGNDTVLLTLGLSLAATDVVTVYAGAATLSFGLFGVEMS